MKCLLTQLTFSILIVTTSLEASPEIDLSASDERPNIILVMADDQGWGDVGFNGHPFVKTPQLDAMAREGFIFHKFYAGAPVCSPTRASVLTGRNPIRTNVPNHGHYMRPQEMTLAEALKIDGYITGLFGKFHLGSGQPDSPANPSAMGFDEWVIGLNSFDNDPFLSRNGRVQHRQGKGTVLVVDDTIDFLEKHKDVGKPMFAVVWFPSPHRPHKEVPSGTELYSGKKEAGYFREITLLDQQVGRLRHKLRELDIAANTILWYCSDNGGLIVESSGGRGKKGSIYEGGLRVPSLIEWPARGLKGHTSVPIMASDMYPTLLAMVGVSVMHQLPLDGIDITTILEGSATSRSKPMGFWHDFQEGKTTHSDRILQSIMKKQQAADPTPHDPPRIQSNIYEFPQFPLDTATGHAAWIDWPWKLHRLNDGTTYELYNLKEDPMESIDLIDRIKYQDRLASMKGELTSWMRSVVKSINGYDYSKLTK